MPSSNSSAHAVTKPLEQSFDSQRVHIVEQVADGLLVGQDARHGGHMRAVEILRMRAPDALAEILELPLYVPVAHVCQPGRVGRPDALAVRAVAGGASRVVLLAPVGIAGHRGLGT